jgi:hypothetical protein
MDSRNRDLFPTTTISVPNLVPLLQRIRAEERRRVITLLHVRTQEEGEWICSTAAARLSRGNIKIIGPEALKPLDLIERAIRGSAKVVFAGEMRREEDSRALRAAATLGIRAVAYIVAEKRKEAENVMTILGAWNSFDVALLSTYG